ncbi:Uncharacterised protein [Mycobacterium tuberculosis]|nr:Uncharacterised protein [Mycobacterium tuberculosis]
MTASSPPTSTVSSSWAMILVSTPAAGEGISVSTLSVDTSTRGSSSSTVSPSCLSQRVTVPSVTLSPSAGIWTEKAISVDSSIDRRSAQVHLWPITRSRTGCGTQVDVETYPVTAPGATHIQGAASWWPRRPLPTPRRGHRCSRPSLLRFGRLVATASPGGRRCDAGNTTDVPSGRQPGWRSHRGLPRRQSRRPDRRAGAWLSGLARAVGRCRSAAGRTVPDRSLRQPWCRSLIGAQTHFGLHHGPFRRRFRRRHRRAEPR